MVYLYSGSKLVELKCLSRIPSVARLRVVNMLHMMLPRERSLVRFCVFYSQGRTNCTREPPRSPQRNTLTVNIRTSNTHINICTSVLGDTSFAFLVITLDFR